MAKIECRLKGSFYEILSALNDALLSGSLSATLEDSSDFVSAGCRCAVRVYERYSWMGGNRVSLSLTLLECGEAIHLSVITSGGSQAVFFKVNTIGEESFLNTVRHVVEAYRI
ncbi:MAG: hypothetical protein E7655_08635 [Ruminococcaceae bacterium]|nr:hypothetical protein [Oscillospiraceae bacterium]